ncbi:MAG: hypothetical protein J2P43_10700 [Candidatus Dormibacteraeota bacterium]|nr:hypothetical protein [Candidatus Dormibacteraeota bacterium]
MSSEAERLAELVADLGRRLSQAFGDVVSPEAQRHLRNAQREVLTALFLIYEEQLGRRTGRGSEPAPTGDEGDWPRDMEETIRRARADPDADVPRSRVKKIDVD